MRRSRRTHADVPIASKLGTLRGDPPRNSRKQQRLDTGWSGSAEVGAAGEVLVDFGARELVEPEALSSRAAEGRAWAERQLRSRFELQTTGAEFGQRLVEVGHAVEEYRRVAGQVIGEHHSWSLRCECDLPDARAHRLDREDAPAAKDVAVEREVGFDVTAGQVQDVEPLDRHHVLLPAPPRPCPREHCRVVSDVIATVAWIWLALEPASVALRQSGRV